MAAAMLGSGMAMPAKELSRVNSLQIMLDFIPKNTEVLGGTAVIVVNGNTRKLFSIFPQIDTNPIDGTPHNPYIVIATNLGETSLVTGKRLLHPLEFS